jgi:hypothetical protein
LILQRIDSGPSSQPSTPQPEFLLLLKPSPTKKAADTSRASPYSKPEYGDKSMRKTIAAVTAGLLLVAGQAAAANNSAVARVGDRVGAQSEASSEFAGVPVFVLLIGAAVLVTTVVVASDDASESD